MAGESETPKFQPNSRVEREALAPEVTAFVGAAGLWLRTLDLPDDQLGDIGRRIFTQSAHLSVERLLLGRDAFLALTEEAVAKKEELSPLEGSVLEFGRVIGIELAEQQTMQGFRDLFAAKMEDVSATPATRAAGDFIRQALQNKNVSLEDVLHNPLAKTMMRNLVFGLEYAEGDNKHTTLSQMLSRGEEVARREQVFTKALDQLVKELSRSQQPDQEAVDEIAQTRSLLEESLTGHERLTIDADKLTAAINNICERLDGEDPEWMPESMQFLRLLRDHTLEPLELQVIRAFLAPGEDFKPMSVAAIAEMLNKQEGKGKRVNEKEVRTLVRTAIENLTSKVIDARKTLR